MSERLGPSFSVEGAVQERYSQGAAQVQEQLCCPTSYDPALLKAIPTGVSAEAATPFPCGAGTLIRHLRGTKGQLQADHCGAGKLLRPERRIEWRLLLMAATHSNPLPILNNELSQAKSRQENSPSTIRVSRERAAPVYRTLHIPEILRAAKMPVAATMVARAALVCDMHAGCQQFAPTLLRFRRPSHSITFTTVPDLQRW